MEKIETQAVTKYLVKKGIKAKDNHMDFQNKLGHSTPSYSTVANWTNEFRFGRESLVQMFVELMGLKYGVISP